MEINYNFTVEDIKKYVNDYIFDKYGNSIKCEVITIKVTTDESNNLISGNIIFNINKE